MAPGGLSFDPIRLSACERAVRLRTALEAEAVDMEVRKKKAAAEYWPQPAREPWKFALPGPSFLKAPVPDRSWLKPLDAGEKARKVSWAKPHGDAWPTELFPMVRVTDPEHGELFHTQAWCKLQLGLARSGVMVDPPTGRV